MLKKFRLYQYIRWLRFLYVRFSRTHKKGKILFGISSLYKIKVYRGEKKYTNLLSKVELDKSILEQNKYFYYSIDKYKTIEKTKYIMGNLTIDYSLVTDVPLEVLKERCNEEQIELLDTIKRYANRTANFLHTYSNSKFEYAFKSINNLFDGKSIGFQDALQRILFVNQVVWQCGHRLIGLGRLDKVLETYYIQDIKRGILDFELAKEMVKEFILTLHRDYWFKGNVLSGDTGQIIILGGLDETGEYFYNDLTELFIEAIRELNIPDPKILLRVSEKMPRHLMKEALECVQTGVGSPLFANDDIIVPALTQYGYDRRDAYNYVTAACWEPTIFGKSSEQNNCEKINYVKPLENLLRECEIKDFEELKLKYYSLLKQYIKETIESVAKLEYQKAPILSIFIQRNNSEDIAYQSAIYSDYGLTTVGLSNVVNSLLVIKKKVWGSKEYTFKEITEACIRDYIDKDAMNEELKEECRTFWGRDEKEVIELANEIIRQVNIYVKEYEEKYKIRVKIGLSSPDYLIEGKRINATPDGRRAGKPLGVHISSEGGAAYTEIVNFAASLNTSGRNINGNVVDLMISPNLIKDNLEKFIDFMYASIEVGFFEMQMNVISSKILIDAKKHPDRYPQLIVRVWGFSAYFNELPDEYKDILIERALKNERIYY